MMSIIIILLVTILNPAMAKAGVVIEQRITFNSPGEPGSVRKRTLMLQGDKERFQIDDRMSIVIDADSRTVAVLDDLNKSVRELPLKRVIGTTRDPNYLLYMAFKSTDKTRELLGFKCRDYTGTAYIGATIAVTTACFSTDAAGSDDFSHFMKSMVRDSGPPGRSISVPAGVPLIIESTLRVNPALASPDIPAQETVRFRNRISKMPPQVTRVVVTKITSEKLSPDKFSSPAGYTRHESEPD